MIVVTGGCGFIGSNIVKALNNRGITDILVVDDLQEGIKFKNIADCEIWDYMDKDDFLQKVKSRESFIDKITAIFHEGACSATTEWDGRYIMRNNYEYSKELLHYCIDNNAAFLYASSASVYGRGTQFEEKLENEDPLNVYAYSKFQFDQYVRRLLPTAKNQIVGFRYFNVYGPREQHKGVMSSMAYHFNTQIKETVTAKIFEACEKYDNGEQRRDFVYIDDAVDVNLWFLDHPEKSGIFNLGTGTTHSFNELAKAVINWHGKGKIEYIPFPEKLKGRYQSFTQANINSLRSAGYEGQFKSVEVGVDLYLSHINTDITARSKLKLKSVKIKK